MFKIHELETAVTYDDIYTTISEAQAQIEEYIKDDNNKSEPRMEKVTYIVIDENGNEA